MFNKHTLKERIGPLKKAVNLKAELEPVEAYFLEKAKQYEWETSYDVIAQEMPYFKTMGYTEYATCFIFQPLNTQMRSQQMRDAYQDQDVEVKDYAAYFRENINTKRSNKYQDRKNPTDRYEVRENLVVLPGSNKLKDRTCLNKLNKIIQDHKGEVWLKPHPITTHQVIGELKDIFGEQHILDRDLDIYHYLKFATKIYTTHISESAMYAVALGKQVEPIDVLNNIEMGSFYNINRFLFEHQENGKEWINKTLSSPKSGFICPALDTEWTTKVDQYCDYIQAKREACKNWFIDQNPKPKRRK